MGLVQCGLEDAPAGDGGGGGGTDPETLFDNHPTFVEIGTLASNITSTITSLTLAAIPTETVAITDFLLVHNEVIDISVVNGAVISGSRGARGTLEAVHLAGTPVYLLTTSNGGLGRTLTTRTWAYGTSHDNAFDLGKVLTEADDDGKECLIEVEYDATDARRYGSVIIGAQTLRELRSLARTATGSTHETFPLIMQRIDQITLTANAPMFLYFGRKRFDSIDASNYGVTDGNDGLRLAIGSGGNAALMYRFYMRVTLISASGGAAAQSAGSGLLLAEQSLIANKVLLDEYDLDTEWSAVGANDTLYFAGIHQDSVDRVELGFNISSHYQRPVTITGRQLKEIGSHSFPTLPVAATTVDAIYVSGRTVGSFDSREPMLINPKYGFLEERRAADRFGILMFFSLNTSGNWISLQIYVSSDEEIDLDYAYIIPRGAAA